MKKLNFTLVFLVVMSLLIAACGPGGAPAADSSASAGGDAEPAKDDGTWDDPHIQELLQHLARTSLSFKHDYQIARREKSWRPEVVKQALSIARGEV